MSKERPTSSEYANKETAKLAGVIIDRLKSDRTELLSVVKMILWCKPHKVSLDALKEVAKKAIERVEEKH